MYYLRTKPAADAIKVDTTLCGLRDFPNIETNTLYITSQFTVDQTSLKELDSKPVLPVLVK